MLLKTDGIQLLQDARYCAAEGFDFLVFNFRVGDPGKVSAELVQEVMPWLSGTAAGLFTNTELPEELIHMDFQILISESSQLLQQYPQVPIRIQYGATTSPGATDVQIPLTELQISGQVPPDCWAELPLLFSASYKPILSACKGLSFGSEFYDGEGQLNYDAVDLWLSALEKEGLR